MSDKSFSTQKKVSETLAPYSDQQSHDKSLHITGQFTSSHKVLQDTAIGGLFRLSALLSSEATPYPQRVLKATAHGASAGDVVRFESTAQNPYFEASVLNVPDANTMILAAILPVPMSVGDDFYILRFTTSRVDNTGAVIAVVTSGPIEFVLNGTPTQVSTDTITPANSRPLPVDIQNALVKVPYDQIVVTAVDGSDQPTTIEYRLSAALVATLTIVYDGSGNFQSVVVS